MTWSEMTLLVAAALLVLLWLIWAAATRLDRLHRKVASTRVALEHQLVRRASAAAGLATSGLLDPVSSLLVGEAAWAALAAPDDSAQRDLVESELSRTVREVLGDEAELEVVRGEPGGEELVQALAAAWYRVQLARRFHNEAVAQTQRVRRKVIVRALRLHGHAALPRTVEIDDAWPDPLQRMAQAA